MWTDENCNYQLPFICYSVSSVASSRQYHFISVNKSWSEAQTYCRQNYTDLATIDNMTEMNSVMNTVNGSYNGSAWIGLYDDVNSWRWSLDDDDFYQEGEREFRNWYHQPDNYDGNELCVYMNYDGKWFDSSCDYTLPFVCYNRNNNTHSYIGIYDRRSWTEAQRYCRQYYTDLANVRNQTENQKILESTGGQVWIGLYRNRIWSNGQNTKYLNWRPETPYSHPQPDNGYSVYGEWGNQHCTAVSLRHSGRWTDENCLSNRPFICYSRNCTQSSCSPRQYHFISVNKSWSEAQTYCRQNYTDLATIDNMTEMNSVMNTVNGSYDGSAWIGLYDDVNSWRWSLDDDDFYQEGEREFRNWYHEPDNYRGNELCVYMWRDGSWFDSSCDNSFPFVCYDGRGNTSQRYIWVNQHQSWSEAQRYCREFYTDLAIVRNETEHQQILNVTDSNDYYGWIGLYRNRLWSDQSNSSFTYWLPGTQYVYPQPDNGINTPGLQGTQHCTAVSLQSFGQWTDESCFERLPFFCYGGEILLPSRS
ncbi:C-type mannose receptor 2 [Triplophysa rosa]|uniref:C-type mannose receptor 2 n=1 Tax=Triplophysa rosa TaxID=992332 RepID=UPI002546022E|nr:C-type mannose receptor 2 [Triplophysa rosa]